jgi:hypothetical protein
MSEINFGLLQPVDVGALTQQGFSTGMAMVKQVQTKNALRAYLDNPDNPQAYNALAAFDPAAAATIQTQQMSRSASCRGRCARRYGDRAYGWRYRFCRRLEQAR